MRNVFLCLAIVLCSATLSSADQSATSPVKTPAETQVVEMLTDLICKTDVIQKMQPVLELERQLKAARLTYDDYKRIHDQLDFYWTDVRPVFRSQLEKSKVKFSTFQSVAAKQERFWNLSGDISDNAQRKCPRKHYQSHEHGGIVAILISIGDRFLRIEVP